ncbi:hypothetical protein HWV62_34541 [Athelia sp. TMB]|nr:hypothetical protein HWV62_34541 [Athelia sp. TMB]
MPIGLSGFRSWISCGGHEIACQNVELSEDGMEVTCWIASEAGKVRELSASCIVAIMHQSICALEILGELDQAYTTKEHRDAGRGAGRRHQVQRDHYAQHEHARMRVHKRGLYHIFEDHQAVHFWFTGSDGVYEGNTSSSAAAPAGEIRLSIWEVAVMRQENRRTVVALPDNGAAHMVRLGPETGRPRATNNLKSRKLGSGPVATFIFKYQSGYKATARSKKGGLPPKGKHEGSARGATSGEGENDAPGEETEEETDEEDDNGDEEEAVNDEPPQQYICNLRVVYTGSSSQMPTNAIEEVQGRSNDIGKDMGGSFVWLVPEYTATKVKALTSISVEIHEKPWDGHDDLAKEARGTRHRYLHFEKNPDEPKKIDQIVLVRSEPSESPHVSDEYSTLSGNINESRGGDFLFLAWSTIPKAEKMY